ncbi:1,2-phenylacetyl-CoA epoxidase subunit PaaE [Ottowia oryzae]|uniref:Phenylacetate-CoA oxygenase/reductase subunit PaaK n=1 Tax=Ottowia oryzae TaxID=2109914 RepID=A0A2S0MAQ1_9BURK|nr:1,2-phenylacetyl-CoA epoxidase subunit PaaE [Ottowia oryzae]AVO32896.1 phenylacetate-CoA oxygenase/reductase subunit PaaK [Ottowia oryzae]
MSAVPRFHDLTVARVNPEAAGAVAITFAVPAELQERFAFEPGQFLTLRSTIDGQDVRRNYSICSTRSRYGSHGELEVGIRPMDGGVFSNWAATQLKAGDTLAVMPPDGRFTIRKPRALHRVGFAAGSGITPILSIIASTMEESDSAKFTLVYGNRRMSSVMFNEALQDLKDKYKNRLTLIHVLSRQAQEVPLLEGRIDVAKVQQLIATLLPAKSMDEVFVCGPEAMIDAVQGALTSAGVPADRIYSERFTSPTLENLTPDARRAAVVQPDPEAPAGQVQLTVLIDGKSHELAMRTDQHVLDVALSAGLNLPYSCKAGVCCTCRAKVLDGAVVMDKNFTLEGDEMAQGFVLSCQARPTSDRLVVSYDER